MESFGYATNSWALPSFDDKNDFQSSLELDPAYLPFEDFGSSPSLAADQGLSSPLEQLLSEQPFSPFNFDIPEDTNLLLSADLFHLEDQPCIPFQAGITAMAAPNYTTQPSQGSTEIDMPGELYLDIPTQNSVAATSPKSLQTSPLWDLGSASSPGSSPATQVSPSSWQTLWMTASAAGLPPQIPLFPSMPNMRTSLPEREDTLQPHQGELSQRQSQHVTSPGPRQNRHARARPSRLRAKDRRKKECPETCNFCGKGHPYIAALHRHIRVHHPEEAVKLGISMTKSHCTKCNKSYARSDHLSRHSQKEHGWPSGRVRKRPVQ